VRQDIFFGIFGDTADIFEGADGDICCTDGGAV